MASTTARITMHYSLQLCICTKLAAGGSGKVGSDRAWKLESTTEVEKEKKCEVAHNNAV